MNDPCRVTGELARYEAAQNNAEPDEVFDEYQDEHVAAVVPKELAGPVQELLLALRQIKMTEASFGVSSKIALDVLVPDLEKLRAACVERWRNL